MLTKNNKRYLIFPAIILIGIIVGLVLSSTLNIHQISLAEKSRVPPGSQEELDKISDALAQLAEAVNPSIVSITTTKIDKQKQKQFEELYNNPFFRKFFGEPYSPKNSPEQFQTSILGSGVIVSGNGYILTNNHVISGAEKIVITMQDKRIFIGQLIGADPESDLALLKIEALNLPALVMADNYNLRVGELVVALGTPFGLSHTVTMGIVSAVGRSHVGIEDYEDFIQTDAAINPGNSGGALVNSNGDLVGINTAIFSTSGGNMGIGFAIPVKMAKSFMDNILKHGRVIRGWLGVSIQEMSPALADYFGLKEATGALIANVIQGGPAEKAGLQREDIIIAFNGKQVQNATELRDQIAGTAPGTKVTITVIRKNEKKQLQVILGQLPAKITENTGVALDPHLFYGAHLEALTPQLRNQWSLPQTLEGVLVIGVESNSQAGQVLQQGDVILQVNRKNISNLQELQKWRKDFKDNQAILLLIYRNGSSLYVTL